MRLTAVVLAVPCLLAVCAAPCLSGPLPDLPSYEGARLVTEVNLTDQDLLGFIKNALSAASSGMMAGGKQAPASPWGRILDLKNMAAIIAGVKAVQMRQFHLDAKPEPPRVLEFYGRSAGGDWNKMLYDVSQPGTGFLLLSKPGMSQTIFVAVMPGRLTPQKLAKEVGAETTAPPPEAETGASLVTVQVDGMLDAQKLGSWLGSVVSAMTSKPWPQPAKQPTAKQPAPKKKPGAR